MQSDKFLFCRPEAVLDKIEGFASCYGFETKEVLQIRLLAEEIISVIRPTLTLSDGRCWITTDDKAFSVTIDCDAGISGLDEATKKQLLGMGSSGKKHGFFSMLDKVFELLSTPGIDYNAYASHHMICSYGMGADYSGYYWNPAFFSNPPTSAPARDEEKNDHDLEISIIEGCADDIQVKLQRSKYGVRLEITVIKNFSDGQTDAIEF